VSKLHQYTDEDCLTDPDYLAALRELNEEFPGPMKPEPYWRGEYAMYQSCQYGVCLDCPYYISEECIV